MDAEQLAEYLTIRDQVYHALHDGSYVKQSRGRQICQLLILGSFENPISWHIVEVLRTRLDAETYLHRVCWRADLDLSAFMTPVERLRYPRPYAPTIEVGSVLINRDEMDQVLTPFQQVLVPLNIPEHPILLDGVSFELTLGGLFCSSRIHWSNQLPEAWHALELPIVQLQAFFERSWQEGGQQPQDTDL